MADNFVLEFLDEANIDGMGKEVCGGGGGGGGGRREEMMRGWGW